jgi:hypothetical protein
MVDISDGDAGSGADQRWSVSQLPVSRKQRSPHAIRVEVIALVVLLAALGVLVWSAVGGASRIAVVATCDANARVVSEGVAGLRAENAGAAPTTSVAWQSALLPGSSYAGAPFLQAWPHSPQYLIGVAGSGLSRDSGDAIVPANGDVLVTVVATNKAYDTTVHPGSGCGLA